MIYSIESGRIDRKYTQSQFKLSGTLQLSGMTDELAGARYARFIKIASLN